MSAPGGGRHVLITGVSRGLGRAMARGFAARGHRISGCARSGAALQELAGELGEGHCLVETDVADDSAVRAWADRTGPPDLLINNAALMNRPGPAWQLPAEEFDELMRVNVGGTMNLIRAFLPSMIAHGSGVVANFSSGWGRSTSPEVAPYCASKWAIEGLSRAIAQEVPEGLAVVAVNPGVIDTPMLRTCWGDAAGSFPGASRWAERAVPFLEGLSAADNGRSVEI